jgi:hypothetical protein
MNLRTHERQWRVLVARAAGTIKSQSTVLERAGTMTVKSSLGAKRQRATMRQDGANTTLRSSIKDVAATRSAIKRALVVDIGGTSVKILATGQTEGRSFPSGPTLTPARMVSGVEKAGGGLDLRRGVDRLSRRGLGWSAGCGTPQPDAAGSDSILREPSIVP